TEIAPFSQEERLAVLLAVPDVCSASLRSLRVLSGSPVLVPQPIGTPTTNDQGLTTSPRSPRPALALRCRSGLWGVAMRPWLYPRCAVPRFRSHKPRCVP